MKTIVCLIIGMVNWMQLFAQSQELQQLRLDMEKLVQFKAMLAEMKSGYQSMVKGYGLIIKGAADNYDLHSRHLQSLLDVSESVKRDPTLLRIQSNQTRIAVSYRTLLSKYQSSGLFSTHEIAEIAKGFQPILETCQADLALMSEVLGSGKLRMTDAERLSVLAKVDQSVSRQQARFNQRQQELDQQLAMRRQSVKDREDIRKLTKGQYR